MGSFSLAAIGIIAATTVPSLPSLSHLQKNLDVEMERYLMGIERSQEHQLKAAIDLRACKKFIEDPWNAIVFEHKLMSCRLVIDRTPVLPPTCPIIDS